MYGEYTLGVSKTCSAAQSSRAPGSAATSSPGALPPRLAASDPPVPRRNRRKVQRDQGFRRGETDSHSGICRDFVNAPK